LQTQIEVIRLERIGKQEAEDVGIGIKRGLVPPYVAVLLALTLILGACGGGSQQSGTSRSEVVELGAKLYDENCASCHGGESGGAISDSPPRHNANGHTWHHPDCLLADITLRGAAAWGADPSTSAMPAFAGDLSVEEVDAILAFIKTWWTDEQRSYQAEVTQTNCGS
jgi:mono/diheme cytochrome c family protein